MGAAIEEMNRRLQEVETREAAPAQAGTLSREDVAEIVTEVTERAARNERAEGGLNVARRRDGLIVPEVSHGFGEFLTRIWKKDTRELNATTGADGGYLVPQQFIPELIQLVEVYGLARQRCRVIPMTSDEAVFPALDGGVTLYWPGENAAITESNPTFKEVKLNAKTLAGLTHAPHNLLRDANPALGQILADVFGRAFAKEEDRAVFTYDVSGASKPFDGVLYAASVNEVVTSGTNFNSITADNLLELIDAVGDAATIGARFYLNRTILSHIKRLKDADGNYIWQGPSAGEPATIWGYPYTTTDIMPGQAATAADKPFVFFGNLIYMFLGDRAAYEVATSEHFAFNKMQTFLRFSETIAVKAAIPSAWARLLSAAA